MVRIKHVFLILFVIWFLIRAVYARKSFKKPAKVTPRAFVDYILVAVNFFGMMVIPVFAALTTKLDFAAIGLPEFISWLALVIYALNLGLFAWSHHVLGANWSAGLAVKQEHTLIQVGPYKWVRHPMYTHFWVLVISQGLALDNWLVLVFGVLSWGVLYFWRVGREEAMMLREFGDAYKKYMDTTGRLLPKIR